MATPFSIPLLSTQARWGPPELDDLSPNASGKLSKYKDLPFSPFGRGDRLGRAADFTSQHKGNRMKRRDDDEVDDAFQLVDTAKAQAPKRFVNPASKRRQQSQRLRQVNARRQQSTGGPSTGMDRMSKNNKNQKPMARNNYRAGGRNWQNRVDRQPSVAVQSEWTQVEEIDVNKKLIKNMVTSTDVPRADDILMCGVLDHYNDAYDKVTSRQPPPLKRADNKEFYPASTTDDPVLEKLAIEGMGQVFITDTILSHLMTCTRSVFPWDIVVQKLPSGTIFFDKRDNSQFDYLTVNETASNQPSGDEVVNDNTPERLGLEATIVNQNFSQQVLKKTGRKEMDLPNPFYDEEEANGMEPASMAFRYRKYQLDADTVLVCRTELHGIVKNSQYMTAFALNEYIPPVPSPTLINWRDKIDNQRGAVLANELKNNSFKLAKWTAQSLLADADIMKIGFVSRTNRKNLFEHVVLGTGSYRPKDMATQIGLNEGNMWATFRFMVSMMQKHEAGKYVLMRHPNKATLYLFKVPPETFEEEE